MRMVRDSEGHYKEIGPRGNDNMKLGIQQLELRELVFAAPNLGLPASTLGGQLQQPVSGRAMRRAMRNTKGSR
jgi:hypothetical protein